MFLAFLLNGFFSVFELAGSFITGSISIASDAIHDLGDAITIGISWLLEKKSNRQPDDVYTYGYRRYSVLAGLFTTLVLLAGSVTVISHAVGRILTPKEVHYDSMILFAVVGVVVNFCAAYVTHGGHSVNQKAVNLHMLEDVLGWIAVLLGAIVIKVTRFWVVDPILSILVAAFVLVNALKNLKNALDILLEKTPRQQSVKQLESLILENDGVIDVHHIHLWSMDGITHYATLHLVTNEAPEVMKNAVRETLHHHGIAHVTLELETPGEHCHERICTTDASAPCCHHHHH